MQSTERNQKINSEIYEKLNMFEVVIPEALGFLIPCYFGIIPEYIPGEVVTQVFATGIISLDKDGDIVWEIPLFEGEESGPFDWVEKEYIEIFNRYDSTMLPYKRECKARMIKLFKENPDIRKHEVLGATELYFNQKPYSFTDSPHYFIEKGKGRDRVQKILSWIDLYRDLESKQSAAKSSSNTWS